MDVTAKEKGDVCRNTSDLRASQTEDHVPILQNLLSSIPNSCIYRKEEFICSKLASGFYGDIFKVHHRETGEMMVLKMNKPEVELENCTMLDEIKLMSHLSHPNIIRFIGVCIYEGQVHLLCEYINGGDLQELLLDYSIKLQWSTRLYLAKDIAEGMRYLHKQGVIHRDLTSKNCLIKEVHGWRYGVVADLGLATEIKEQSIVGSPFNMAPELLRGEAYDEKADVFSYGIILCEIIGRVPADPDELPRTKKFGVDVEKFQQMTGDCPNEFLQTALCCCQMEPRTRPTFIETSKHLEFILVGHNLRPEIEEAMNTPVTEPRLPLSAEQLSPSLSGENKRGNNSVISGDITTSDSSPLASPPAIIVSAEASPPLNVRSAEKRRQSWIIGRYKMFNVATDDLLKNTPGKLKRFFHRAIRTQTHFHPAKQKKVRDGCNHSSATHLKTYSMNGEDGEHASFGLADSISPSTHSRRFLSKKTSEQDLMYNFSLKDDSVDGRYKLRSVKSDSSFSSPSNSHRHRSSSKPKLFGDFPFCRLPDNFKRFGYPVCKDIDESSTPRSRTAARLESDLNPESRRTLFQTETSRDHKGSEEKHNHHKSAFWIFKRKGSKEKNSF